MEKQNLYKEDDEDDEEEELESEEEGIEDSVIDFGDIMEGINLTNINLNNTVKSTINKEKNTINSNLNNKDKENSNVNIQGNTIVKEANNYNMNKNINEKNSLTENKSNHNSSEKDYIHELINPGDTNNDKEIKIDLLDLDLKSVTKEEIINILLKEETPEKKPKNKYKLNPKAPKSTTSTMYTNLRQMSETKDPELSQDFNVALNKVLSKIIKESDTNNNSNSTNSNHDVLDLLLGDREKIEEDLNKVN